jgi:hypothetical protein
LAEQLVLLEQVEIELVSYETVRQALNACAQALPSVEGGQKARDEHGADPT